MKRGIYILGIITLLVFPIPAFLLLYFLEGITFIDFFELESFTFFNIIIGSLIGICYALIANKILKLPIFKTVPLKVDELVRSLNLTLFDAFFLSICAGVGEELLFRAGIQHYLGLSLTSILFVAVHGYLNPMNWKQSLYGLVVLPLAFILGICYVEFGLWFAIAIHTSYDLVLFIIISQKKDATSEITLPRNEIDEDDKF